MIGWWIVIAAQTPEERDQAADRKAAVLATWEVGLGGIDWLHRLTETGKAIELSRSGYPNRYTAKAGDVLPLLAGGPSAHSGPAAFGETSAGSGLTFDICSWATLFCPRAKCMT